MNKNTITINEYDDKFGTYIGNGTLGLRLFGSGVANREGEATPCFMAGLYSHYLILPIPSIGDIRFPEFHIDKENYSQTLYFETETLNTKYTIKNEDKCVDLDINTSVLRLDLDENKVYIQIKGKSNYTGILPFEAPVKIIKNQDFMLKSRILGNDPNLLRIEENKDYKGENKKYNIYGSKNTDKIFVCQNVFFNGKKTNEFFVNCGEEFVIDYIGEVSFNKIKPVEYEEISVLHKRHLNTQKSLWNRLEEKNIKIDDENIEKLFRVFVFYLLCSASEKYSVPPMGLSSDIYSGHIFWDADLWIFPALLILYPEFAKAIIKYRIDVLEGARKNALDRGYDGIEYGWETAEDGIETIPHLLYSRQRHVNSDACFAIWQYYKVIGDREFLEECYPVLKGSADYWVSFAEKTEGKYEIRQVMPPNEYADLVNNSVYTNATCQINMWIATRAAEILGKEVNPKWMEIANNMKINVEEGKFKAFDEYEGQLIKQADAELLIYPYKYYEFVKKLPKEYDFDFDLFVKTYDYYMSKVDGKEGPAMSNSAWAVIDKKLNRDFMENLVWTCKGFLRGPYYIFNETRMEHEYENRCFLTGVGTFIASVLWIYMDLDFDYYEIK